MTARLLVSMAARILAEGTALLAATTVLLLLLRAAPGDAVDLITVDEALRARLSMTWQLDAPLHEAVTRALSGQWGTSWTVRPGRPVTELIREAATQSVPLLTCALFLTISGGVTLGRYRTSADRIGSMVSVMPIFLLGWGAIVGLNELTFSGMSRGLIARPDWFSLPDTDSRLRFWLAAAVLTIGSGNLRAYADQVRGRLDAHRRSSAIETLHARGMPTGRVLWRLLIPDLALITAERAAFLFGGLVVLERVFSMPGLGSLFFEACVQRDQPVVLASGVVAAAGVVTVRALADFVRLAADPRLREVT